MVGKPRILASAVWCCLGLAWVLLAVLDGPTVTRFLPGAAWLAIGVFSGVVALLDRKHKRGFYQTATPVSALDDRSERE